MIREVSYLEGIEQAVEHGCRYLIVTDRKTVVGVCRNEVRASTYAKQYERSFRNHPQYGVSSVTVEEVDI